MDFNKDINNFTEMFSGYSFEQAILEASRCLQCIKPTCIDGCPIEINIPKFIFYLKKGNIRESYKNIFYSNAFPSICGRVCPQEKQCEFHCILNSKNHPIKIGNLERYVADNIDLDFKYSLIKIGEQRKEKIAIIGAGPAGITASFYLRLYGYNITIYEAFDRIGGVLLYGIPEFRLPKKEIKSIYRQLVNMNIKIENNYVIGQMKNVDILSKENEAVFIGTGAGIPLFLNINGENLNNIYSANEYLTRINLMKAYNIKYETPIKNGNNVIIIGGGNVAIDAARCAIRLGSKNVIVLYRKSEKELPARKEEVKNAILEGVHFIYLSTPISFSPSKIDKKDVGFVNCIKMEASKSMDELNKTKYIKIKNSEFSIEADIVIVAIGTKPNTLIFKNSNLIKKNMNETIEVNKNLHCKNTNIFSGGDIVNGSSTVIQAIEQGKKAAFEINKFINQKMKNK